MSPPAGHIRAHTIVHEKPKMQQRVFGAWSSVTKKVATTFYSTFFVCLFYELIRELL